MDMQIIVGQTYKCRDDQYRRVIDIGVGIYHFAPAEVYVKYEILGKPGEWFKTMEHFKKTIEY
jgi:hypothetical protein